MPKNPRVPAFGGDTGAQLSDMFLSEINRVNNNVLALGELFSDFIK